MTTFGSESNWIQFWNTGVNRLFLSFNGCIINNKHKLLLVGHKSRPSCLCLNSQSELGHYTAPKILLEYTMTIGRGLSTITTTVQTEIIVNTKNAFQNIWNNCHKELSDNSEKWLSMPTVKPCAIHTTMKDYSDKLKSWLIECTNNLT